MNLLLGSHCFSGPNTRVQCLGLTQALVPTPGGLHCTAADSRCSIQLALPLPRYPDSHPAAEPQDAAGEPKTHAFEADPRNEDMLVGIRDGLTRRLVFQWRPAAKVSALDAGFLLGDGVWEGLRVHKGCVLFAWVCSPDCADPCRWTA